MIVKKNTESGVWEKLPDGSIIKECDECKNKCGHNYCGCTPHTSKRDMEKYAKIKQEVIDKLTKDTDIIAHETLRRYFVRLTQYGYYNYEAVYRILALMLVSEFRQEFAMFHNKEDERILQRLLDCLYCSICAIPSPDYITETTPNGETRKDYINYYEDDFKGSYPSF